MNDSQSLPTTASFHPEVIDKYVRDKILKGNPVTWFAPVLGLLAAGSGFAVVQLLDLWMVLAAGGGLAVGLGSFSFDTFIRRDAIRMSYLDEVNRQLEGQAKQTAAWLLEQYTSMGHTQGIGLVQRLGVHMKTFEDILDDKFKPGTETFQHFHGVAEALNIQTLNKLKLAVSQIKANMGIDQQYAAQMVNATTGSAQDSHQRKLDLHAEGNEKVEALLASAETAITGLVELSQKVAGIQSGSMDDFGDFLREVQSLADRAEFYVDERSL